MLTTEAIYKRLDKLMREKRISQSELARMSGVDRSNINQILKGKTIPKVATVAALAQALGIKASVLMGETELIEDAEQILERLRLASPMSVPVVRDFPMPAGEAAEPLDYVYLSRTRASRKALEAYIVRGTCLSPSIEDKDVIIIDRERQIDVGDIVACLYNGELHLGRLKKIADELYIENSHGRIKLTDCPVAAPVIEVVRRLK